MLKENWRLISRLERIGDFLIVLLSFFAAYYGRSSVFFWDRVFAWNLPLGGRELAPLKDYFIVLVLALLAYSVILEVMGAYGSMRLGSSFRLLRISLASSFLVFLLLSAALFLLKLDLSRSFILLFCSLAGLLITGERYLVLWSLRFWRKQGRNYRIVFICGIGEQAVNLAAQIARAPELGIRILGFADLRESAELGEDRLRQFREDLRKAGCHRIGRLITGRGVLGKVLKEHPVDEVIFTDVVTVMPLVEEMVVLCAEQGIRTTIAADLFSIGLVKSGLSYFGTIPLIHFQTPPGDRWDLAMKRAIDLSGSVILLLLFSPVFLLVYLAVRLSSPGQVIFRQKRVGLNGRQFVMYKFRSMYTGAEKGLEALKQGNEMEGPTFKMKEDPRITSVGKLLRRYSLDELPQLWNVLTGEMSLVGPRPPVPGEVNMYERRDRRRLSMRPGMTCIWQVSGRNEIRDFESWVKLDLEYIDNWSLALDFLLLWRTIPAVICGTGAR